MALASALHLSPSPHHRTPYQMLPFKDNNFLREPDMPRSRLHDERRDMPCRRDEAESLSWRTLAHVDLTPSRHRDTYVYD